MYYYALFYLLFSVTLIDSLSNKSNYEALFTETVTGIFPNKLFSYYFFSILKYFSSGPIYFIYISIKLLPSC